MFPPFSTEKAFAECQAMIKEIESGKLCIKPTGKVSQERAGHGVMLGAMVCKNSDGTIIRLRTLSGIAAQLVAEQENCSIVYVEPVVSAEEIEKALSKNDKQIHELTDKINLLKQNAAKNKQSGMSGIDAEPGADAEVLTKKRNALCLESQKKVFDLYSFYCADGNKRSLNEICRNFYGSQTNGKKLPPTGTGDCCAPKLLNYAYKNGLTPLSMCEIFYGKNSSTKVSGTAYPPCDERCALILPEILGLNIVYRDSDIVVVNKQSGVLSVPGRGPDKQDCIVNRLRRLFPECIEQPSVHRLDMETSGLMVLALNAESQRNLRIQFEKSEIQKKYIAVLDGNMAAAGIKECGQMELYFRLDVENRPHQIWDSVNGKKAITRWRILNLEKYSPPAAGLSAGAASKDSAGPSQGRKRTVTRVEFTPLTGRTHQLRLASADSHGFGIPIIGDTLYGSCQEGERLLLHASFLSFAHPVTGKKMEFNCPPPF